MEYVLKVIIAVIVIFFIFIPLGNKLWGAVTGDNKVKQADESMKIISNGIEQTRENGNIEFMIYSPKDWTILDFAPGQEETPDKCKLEFNSCICICDTYYERAISYRQLAVQDCDNKGVCNGFNDVIIHNPSTPENVKDYAISLQSVPRNVAFEKIKNIINIY